MAKYIYFIKLNKAHLVWALMIISINVFSQKNLVPNPGFELFNTNCSNITINLLSQATIWNAPVIKPKTVYGYFNACASQTCCGVPFNTLGHSFQYAHTGNAYIGINSIEKLNTNLRDYIQTKLWDSLRANHCYYIEFFINKHDAWIYANNNMGLLIGDTAIMSYQNIYAAANPQIQLYGNPIITDTMNWVKVGGVYTAHGGEQYITLGNFKDDAHTDTIRFQKIGNTGGSYYIDDVSVYDLSNYILKADPGRDTTIVKGDSVWIGSRLCGLQNVVWYDAYNNVIDTGVPGMWVKPTSNTYYIIEENVCGQYSRDTVNITVAPLPVSMLNFECLMLNERQAKVSWQTATEINVSHFNVQRSTDGVTFYSIGKVNAKGASSYTFNDQSPLWGAGGLYYRLEIVDKNGSITYSEIKELSIINYPLSIAPNPAKDYITIYGGNIKQVMISDISGKVLLKSNEKKIDISALVSGTYIVEIETLNGNHITQKLVKLY